METSGIIWWNCVQPIELTRMDDRENIKQTSDKSFREEGLFLTRSKCQISQIPRSQDSRLVLLWSKDDNGSSVQTTP